MMSHKATMQCGRYAFGFAGIHDEEEADDIAAWHSTQWGTPSHAPPSNARALRGCMGLDRGRRRRQAAAPTSTSPEHTTADPPRSQRWRTFMAQVERAVDTFESEMIIEEASDLLNDEEIRELCAAARAPL
jgi:hypothetical protein